MNNRYTTITLERRNYERLQRLGRVPESFNDVIGRLLDQAEAEKERHRNY